MGDVHVMSTRHLMILSLCQAHEEKLLESLIDTFKKKCMREVGFNRWEWGWNGD
jgi:hypothetical protein